MTEDCPYAALVALAREEHALVLGGRYEELGDLGHRRDLVLERLPAAAPAHAVGHLREAAHLQGLITAALAEAHASVGGELVRLGRTRTGVQGSGAAAGATPRAVDAAG